MDKALTKIAADLSAIAHEVREGHPIDAHDIDVLVRQLEAQVEMIREGLDL